MRVAPKSPSSARPGSVVPRPRFCSIAGPKEALLSGLMADSSEKLAAQAAFGARKLADGRGPRPTRTGDVRLGRGEVRQDGVGPRLDLPVGKRAEARSSCPRARAQFQKASEADPKPSLGG